MAHSHHSLDASDFAPKMANPSAFAKTKHGGSALREFHEFALRGSVLDMAIGIILGVAFGKIISSFVEDLIMPLIGFVFGKVDFSNMFVSLTGRHFDSLVTAKAAGAPTLNYGLFLNATFNFVVVAFGVFLLVRQVNRLRAVRTDADLQRLHCKPSDAHNAHRNLGKSARQPRFRRRDAKGSVGGGSCAASP